MIDFGFDKIALIGAVALIVIGPEKLPRVARTVGTLLGKLLLTAKAVAEAAGRTGDGFRTVINSGPNAGQSVFHIHVHVIAGRPMAWPPG